MRTSITPDEMMDALAQEIGHVTPPTKEALEQLYGWRLRAFFDHGVKPHLDQMFTVRELLELRRDFVQFQIDHDMLVHPNDKGNPLYDTSIVDQNRRLVAVYQWRLEHLPAFLAEFGGEANYLAHVGFNEEVFTDGGLTLAEVLSRQPNLVFKHDERDTQGH